MNFLKFVETGEKREHKLLMILNTRGVHLGWISWYPKWKKYVFHTCTSDVIFDLKCLQEVMKQIKELND